MKKLLTTMTLAAMSASLPLFAQSNPAGGDDAAQMFAQLDTNKDGKLSQSEFAGMPDGTAETFKAWDTDGDNAISQDEFAAKYGKE